MLICSSKTYLSTLDIEINFAMFKILIQKQKNNSKKPAWRYCSIICGYTA